MLVVLISFSSDEPMLVLILMSPFLKSFSTIFYLKKSETFIVFEQTPEIIIVFSTQLSQNIKIRGENKMR